MWDLERSRRHGGRVLAVSGSAALLFALVVLATGGSGPVVFALFLPELTIPGLASAVAATVTGARIAAGRAGSPVGAVVSAAALVVAAGGWAWFWSTFDTASPWYLRSHGLILFETGLLTAISCMSAASCVMLIGRVRRMRRPSWRTGASLIVCGLVVELVGVLVVLGQPRLAPQREDTSAACSALRSGLKPLDQLEVGSPIHHC